MTAYYNPYRFPAALRQVLQLRDDYLTWLAQFTQLSAQLAIRSDSLTRLKQTPTFSSLLPTIDRFAGLYQEYDVLLEEILRTLEQVLVHLKPPDPTDSVTQNLCLAHSRISECMRGYQQTYDELDAQYVAFRQLLLDEN